MPQFNVPAVLFGDVLVKKTYVINVWQAEILLRQFPYTGNYQLGLDALFVKQAHRFNCNIAALTQPFHTREKDVYLAAVYIFQCIRHKVGVIDVGSELYNVCLFGS